VLFEAFRSLHGQSPNRRDTPSSRIRLHPEIIVPPDLEFSGLESLSSDVSRPVFTSLGLGLGLEEASLESKSEFHYLYILLQRTTNGNE